MGLVYYLPGFIWNQREIHTLTVVGSEAPRQMKIFTTNLQKKVLRARNGGVKQLLFLGQQQLNPILYFPSPFMHSLACNTREIVPFLSYYFL